MRHRDPERRVVVGVPGASGHGNRCEVLVVKRRGLDPRAIDQLDPAVAVDLLVAEGRQSHAILRGPAGSRYYGRGYTKSGSALIGRLLEENGAARGRRPQPGSRVPDQPSKVEVMAARRNLEAPGGLCKRHAHANLPQQLRLERRQSPLDLVEPETLLDLLGFLSESLQRQLLEARSLATGCSGGQSCVRV